MTLLNAPPTAPFDSTAATYDRQFDENPITHELRAMVGKTLLQNFIRGNHILELNCGTGTDAVFLAQNGIQITALDASAAMIAEAEKKIRAQNLYSFINLRTLRLEDLHQLEPQQYDGCFSNFGGLNCVRNLSEVLEVISHLLPLGTTMIVGILNKISIWEITSFIMRGKFRLAFRRLQTKAIPVKVGHGTVDVWYYSPKEFARLAQPWFDLEQTFGLNILSPNPSSKKFYTRFPRLTRILSSCDDVIRNLFPFNALGDHFVTVLRRNST